MTIVKMFYSEKQYKRFDILFQYALMMTMILSLTYMYFAFYKDMFEVTFLWCMGALYSVTFIIAVPIFWYNGGKAFKRCYDLCKEHGYFEKKDGDGFLEPISIEDNPFAYVQALQTVFLTGKVSLEEIQDEEKNGIL